MTGKFSEKDPQRCAHYARFFSRLTLPEANGVFWILFSIVLLLMCLSSLQHHKSIALAERDKTLPKSIVNSPRHKLKNRRLRFRMLSIASLCLILSVTATVFECFALFNIQFCDGEDLMQIYWGFWSVLQVGSNIAILGVMVQFWIVLGDVETPSWAVALGTPVLVFAALGFVVKAIWERMWSRCRGKREKATSDEEQGDGSSEDESAEGGDGEKETIDRSMSTAPTIVNTESRIASPSRPSRSQTTPVRPAPPRSQTFWARDLQYLFTSVASTTHGSSREIHHHHHFHPPTTTHDLGARGRGVEAGPSQ